MDEPQVYVLPLSIPAGRQYPLPGSFDFIYLRAAASDQIQVTADGSTWSDLPVGLMFPISGRRSNGQIGPRIPTLRVKDGTAQTCTVVVSVGVPIQDFLTVIGGIITVTGTVAVSSISGNVSVTPNYALRKSYVLADVPMNFSVSAPSNNLRLALTNSGTKTVRLQRLRYRIPLITSGTPAGVSVQMGRVSGIANGASIDITSSISLLTDGNLPSVQSVRLADSGATQFSASTQQTIIGNFFLTPVAALPQNVDSHLEYIFNREEFTPIIKPGESFAIYGGATSAASSFQIRIDLEWTEE